MPVWSYFLVGGESLGTESLLTSAVALQTVKVTGTEMRYSGGEEKAVASYTGTGITTNADGAVTGGTITAITLAIAGDTAITVSGLNVKAALVYGLMADGEVYDLAKLIFSGADEVLGTAKNDALFGFGDSDTLYGNAGADAVSGGQGGDTMYGGSGRDVLHGEQGADRMYGDAGNDILTGGTGSDVLYGGIGNDVIRAEADGARLFGGEGQDYLAGDSGIDRFVFDSALGLANADTIGGFSTGQDKILLDDDVFTELGGPGALKADQFHLGKAAADADDRIIFDSTTGRLWYDADGTGSTRARLIGMFETSDAPVAGDFLIVG